MALNFQRLSILVAEDNPDILNIVCEILKTLGFGEIVRARDGAEAFQRFQTEKHDIILTDWEMEPESGIDFIRRVRTDPDSPDRMVPIILLTGYAAPKRVRMARDLGVTEFVVKPFTAEQLIKRLTHVINKPRNFVEAPKFTGPDRRRRKGEDHDGEDRRRNRGDPQ